MELSGKTLIFDLDGTLVDSNGLWVGVDEEFLARRGLAPTEEYEAAVSRSIFPVAAAYTRDYYRLEDSPEVIMEEWEALADRHYRRLVPMKPGTAEFLRQCKGKGLDMNVFTACRPALCRAALERFGLGEFFRQVVYAEEIGLEKHDPGCFVRLSELIGVHPEQCVLFDDSPNNCATAEAAGMETVGVYDSYYAHRQEELKAVCRRYIGSFEELMER